MRKKNEFFSMENCLLINYSYLKYFIFNKRARNNRNKIMNIKIEERNKRMEKKFTPQLQLPSVCSSLYTTNHSFVYFE